MKTINASVYLSESQCHIYFFFFFFVILNDQIVWRHINLELELRLEILCIYQIGDSQS